jgi:hypothetical protein
LRKPSLVKILGKVYTIKFVGAEGINDSNMGACLDERQEISVRHGLSPDMEKDTVLHECFHAVDFALNTKLTERQVSAFATGVYAMLKENPELVKYLTR